LKSVTFSLFEDVISVYYKDFWLSDLEQSRF
jgi:hypothetical protein